MKIRLGYADGQFSKPIRYGGDAHAILVAPTRTGKGRDILIPALFEYEGSCVVIDPKGQLCAQTAPRRARMGQKIIILNPFKIMRKVLSAGSERFKGVSEKCDFEATYNPMETLDPDAESFGADCDSLTDGIVTIEHNREVHWSESAHELISGMIMELATNWLPNERNLATVRRIVAAPNSDLVNFCKVALASGNTFSADRLARFAEEEAKNANEIASIISTAKTQTKFISNEAIANSLKTSSFRFSDLRREPTTVYVILPTRYLGPCAKWFRLIVASALNELMREPEEDDLDVLLVADEFSQLGRMVSVENAMALAAGYRLQLFIVVQDLTRLKEHYRDAFETFLANAGAQIYFSPRDVFSMEYISKLAGVVEVATQSTSTSDVTLQQLMHGHSGVNVSISDRVRPLLYPHEARQMDEDRMLMFVEGYKGVLQAYRRSYLETPEFNGMYGPDPYHLKRKIEGAK